MVTLPPCHTSLLIVYCKQSQGWATWKNKEHHCKHLCAPLSTLSIIYFFPLLSDLSIAVYRQDNKALLSMPVTESYVIPDISWQDCHCKWRHWTLMAIYTEEQYMPVLTVPNSSHCLWNWVTQRIHLFSAVMWSEEVFRHQMPCTLDSLTVIIIRLPM